MRSAPDAFLSCWFHHVNDRAYFDAIVDEMAHGSDSAHRQVLLTEGLIEQHKLSLGTSEGWWMDCLNCAVHRHHFNVRNAISTACWRI